MSVTLDSFGGLIEAGLFVRPEFASLLDSLPQAELEERFIKHGTVVVHGKDHLLFQAVKVRGTATAREIFFAPSDKSATKSFAVRPSELYSSGDNGNISHVFMNVLGALFAPRTADDAPPSTVLFKVVSLQAAKESKSMEAVGLMTMVGGQAIGSAVSVGAREFFLSYLPQSALAARASALAGRGAAGGSEPGLLGHVDVAASYPELFKSLRAMGAGEAVQYSAGEVAAYAAVALDGPLADDRGRADEAGQALERVLANHASPERDRLRMLHRIGAVVVPRPVLGGRALRQLYFPHLAPPRADEGTPVGVDALAGGPFAEEVALVPPEPPAVRELVPVESPAEKRARVAEELHKREQEAAAQKSLAKAHAKAAKRKQRRRKQGKSAGSSAPDSSSSSSTGESSDSDSDSGSSSGPPKKKKKSKHVQAHAAGRPLTHDEKLVATITPSGVDKLAAAAALFESRALRELAGVDEMPDPAAWTADRRPGLMRRCALGISRLDQLIGSGKWRGSRPRGKADIFVMSEDLLSQLRGDARSPRTVPGAAGQSRRRRSPSSDSSSASSNSGGKAGKRGKGEAFATGGLSPDVAESLNKARKFLEGAGAGSRASGAAAEAVAALPTQLQDLVRRALSADKVSSKGERRECRKSLPAVVERMRDSLVRDVRRALESHMASDMSGRSELPVKEADALAQTIRRLDMSVRSAIAAVKSARGSRAPAAGSSLELQDAWALLRAGLAELDRAVPISGAAAAQIAAQLSTGAAAAGVPPSKCREWLDKVFTTLSSQAVDARQDITASMPTLGSAVAVREAWLKGEIGDERAYQQGARGAGVAREHRGGGGRGTPRESGQSNDGRNSEKRGGGKDAVKGAGKHETKGGAQDEGSGRGSERLWKSKPFVPNDAFKCLRDKFPKDHCWAAVMFGCRKGDACELKHRLPSDWTKMCKACGITA